MDELPMVGEVLLLDAPMVVHELLVASGLVVGGLPMVGEILLVDDSMEVHELLVVHELPLVRVV